MPARPTRTLSLDEATKKLADAKLTVASGTPPQVEVDDDKLVGKVADQNPPAGQSVQAGTQVTLSIGKAQSTIPIPDTTGQTFDKAKANLEQQGFKVDRKDASSDQQEGIVIDQSPKSGKAKPGTTIVLTVSKGDQKKIRMPDFLSKRTTVRDAVQALSNAGWTGDLTVKDLIGNTCRGDSAIDAQIVNQNPTPGTEIDKNANVTLTVSANCST